jgi:hypothetical protein
MAIEASKLAELTQSFNTSSFGAVGVAIQGYIQLYLDTLPATEAFRTLSPQTTNNGGEITPSTAPGTPNEYTPSSISRAQSALTISSITEEKTRENLPTSQVSIDETEQKSCQTPPQGNITRPAPSTGSNPTNTTLPGTRAPMPRRGGPQTATQHILPLDLNEGTTNALQTTPAATHTRRTAVRNINFDISP